MTITIYSKPDCRYCVAAKMFLDANRIDYNEVDIAQEQDKKDWLVGQGFRSVPQIFIGDELFVNGGYAGLKEMSREKIIERINKLSGNTSNV